MLTIMNKVKKILDFAFGMGINTWAKGKLSASSSKFLKGINNYIPQKLTQTQGYIGNKDYLGHKTMAVAKIFAAKAAFGNPDIMLGIVPIYDVQRYEIGRSLEVLKFRAAKGQYFKQQEGHNLSLRINLMLTGPYRELYLSLIEGVYAYGNKQEQEVMYSKSTNVPGTSKIFDLLGRTGPNPVKNLSPKTFGGGTQVGTVLEKAAKPTKFSDIPSNDTTEKAWRKTFTFMSRNDILFDMYIENFLSSRSVRDGYNVINVSLFCRKFEPPVIRTIKTIESIVEKSTEINMESKTYGGLYKTSKSPYEVDKPTGKIYWGAQYTSTGKTPAGGIAKKSARYSILTWFKKFPPNVGTSKVPVYGYNYSNITEVVGTNTPYKPAKADLIDFGIRSAYRLLQTFKKYKESELYFDMTDMGMWNFARDLESTKTPITIKHKIPVMEETKDDFISHINEGLLA